MSQHSLLADFRTHTLALRYSVFFPLALALLGGCGGNRSTNSGANARDHDHTTYDITNTACETARNETLQQPLDAYVAALTTLAEAGKACAQYGLGTLYRQGYGSFIENATLSQHYLTLAAAQGYPGAKHIVDAPK